ncbi:ABC-type transporter, ATP-binding protein (ATPase) [Desulforapulum autotrophicum HRM2]|uniref:ABC-type transporter, ATP-binding protein (ATPase) n=1 Tax=Desulforapulum autotrophicum (strain ATCC 43914 / DSM 3382 / VKM B-1955 / HRM2) TaxID=177437 RepID=C0QBV5_DESAH|nr:ABC-F family ATP-binding cassette domain-containing protein [Desulforapulum autotrophicum]ACN14967.1 ABC-type transporter, ATP-binding protein (ATPase) [Desulforapulum autotrophicum HRM2]
MTLVFSYRSIFKSYGDQPVFDNLTINIEDTERLGLIGGNGSGKSTLLELIADRDTPEKGERYLNKNTHLVYLAQQDELDPDKTIQQTLEDGLAGENIHGQERYRRVKKMIGVGGFTDPSQKCSALSGGWQKRLTITRALGLDPDLFLLDEPTNHLDISGVLWLESILKNPSFAFVVVSHDRAFLESVCTNITELGRCYPQGQISVKGGYNTFEQERTRILATQLKQEEVLTNRMRRETEWLRQGAKARSTKARYRIDQADKLGSELADVKLRNRQTTRIDMDFNGTNRKTRRLLTCQGIEKSLGGKQLFSDITLELVPGTRLGLVGDNGCGKTSLMNILEGTLAPDKGEVKRADQLKVAVFDQNRSRLDPEMTLKQALSPAGEAVIYRGQSIHVVSWAKRFLFTADQLTLPVGRLSGGEKARILMAEIMLTPADLLLLDEPTNDLDIPALEVLEQSLVEFPGAIVLVSHDRFLLDRVATGILFFDGKGNATAHADQSQCLAKKTTPKKKKKTTRTSGKKETPSAKFSYKDKFELEQIEPQILAAEAQVATLEDAMADVTVMSDPDELARVCTELQKAHSQVEQLYARWEELEALKAL